jgi:oxygen-independent coproporphyrinogen III oxidase
LRRAERCNAAAGAEGRGWAGGAERGRAGGGREGEGGRERREKLGEIVRAVAGRSGPKGNNQAAAGCRGLMAEDNRPSVSLPTSVASDLTRTAALALETGGRAAVRSLYIHVPFCTHKCHYCDFYSFVDPRDQQPAFAERLCAELRALARHAREGQAGSEGNGRKVPLRTVFVGGGTPSILALGLWERVLETLGAEFDLSLMGRAGSGGSGLPEGEFTVECNPESTTAELLALLRAGGVNRVSMGAQSFHRQHLATLERRHNPENVAKVVELARAAGIERQSVDLIYAIPGQTLEQWRSDLRTALALGTTHLSCYNLIYEPNTAMAVRLKQGEFVPTDEDTEAAMFEATDEMLAGAGLERYEVSNYARPGHESLHNLAYWRHEQWLAAGPSASGHVYAGGVARAAGAAGGVCRPGYRWKNTPRLGDYLACEPSVAGGYAPISDLEGPDEARAISEVLMMGLRTREGVQWEDGDGAGGVRGRIGVVMGEEQRAAAEAVAAELMGDGLLRMDGERLKVTEKGWLLTDWLVKRLMPG